MQRTAPFRSRFNMQKGWGKILLLGHAAILALGLAACQPGGFGGAKTDIAAPDAIQGPAVEVTTLAPIGDAPPIAEVAEAPASIAPAPQSPAPPPEPAKARTPGQIACEKRGGNFVSAGRSGAMTCQMPTRDGGKQCQRESDCDGVCLARSNTCAPLKPLLGCQAILQDDGRRVELCID